MIKTTILALLAYLSLASAVQAQYYPNDLELIGANGAKVSLLRRAVGQHGERYYVYSEPGSEVRCIGDVTGRKMQVSKSMSMRSLAVVMGLTSARNIDTDNRAAVMPDSAGNAYRVMLPTESDLLSLQYWHDGYPPVWEETCGMNRDPFIQDGPQFWTGTRAWTGHWGVDLKAGGRYYHLDQDTMPVAMQVLKVDLSQACLFQHRQYHGPNLCFGAGDHRWFGDMNDQYSSIIVGKNCSARLYEDGDFGGRSFIFNESRRAAEAMGWLDSMNDKGSSLKVRCGEDSAVEDAEVCLFENGDMRGNVSCHGRGDIRYSEKYQDGLPANDTFSSLVVGKKCSVTLYEHADYVGRSITYSAKSTGRNLKVNGLGDFNDITSSLKVDCD